MSKSQKKPIVKPATRERGEARYFHGRVKILDDFKELLGRAKKGNSGTSLLIQAAPGAGKTALLHECARIARAQRWQIARIKLRDLWHTNTLLQSLGREKETRHKEVTREGNLNLSGGIGDVGNVAISGGRSSTSTSAERTTLEVLKDKKGSLLLVLDEAQRLALTQPEHTEMISDFLDAIHNGGVGRPVILIAAGLGATAAAFDSLGISRFDPGCHINLGPLSEGASRAVIQDWLIEEGGAKGDPALWIDAIAHETHGWPQHIMAYAWPALKQLKSTGGELTPEGLKTILKEGRKGRIEFYEARVAKFESRELHCIANAVADVKPGERVSKEKVMDSLLQTFSKDEAEVIFKRALHKGVLDKRKNDYVIPIPSMHDWLVSNYALALKRTPKFNWYLVARMTNSEVKARAYECTFNEDPAILLPQLTSDALKRLPSPLSGQEWVFDAVDADTGDVIWTTAGENNNTMGALDSHL